MKTPRWIQAFISAVLILFSAFTGIGQTQVTSPATSASERVDESLFLLRLLEMMYENLPDPTQIKNAGELDAAVSERKMLSARIRTRIEDEKLDKRLVPLFSDYDKVMDAIVSFHDSKQSISGKHSRKGIKDSATTGFKYGVTGGVAYSALSSGRDDGNASVEGAALVALGSAAIGFLSDMWQQMEDNKEAEKAELRARVEETMSTYRNAISRAQSVANTLTDERGWKKAEAGWSLDQSSAANVQSLLDSADIRGLLRVANDLIESRPRDPFVRQYRVQLFIAQDDQAKSFKSKDYSSLAKECLRCVALVPQAKLYDDFRKEYLFYGALTAGKARSLEAEAGISPYESTELSRQFLSISDQCVSLDSSDPSGWLRLIRSAALLSDGQVQEAGDQAFKITDLHKENPIFQYQCACILSRMGKFDSALASLRRAFELGHSEIADVKKDPDLAALRRNSKKEFDELVAVKFEWKIEYGVFNDDLIVWNKSAFPITNVKLTPILQQEGKQWKPDLRPVAVIYPGQSYKWVNSVSIPGGRLTSAKAGIECDQNK